MGSMKERLVGHIWRRLGFGASGADLDHGMAIGPRALIDELLQRRLTTPAQWRLPAMTSWEDQTAYLGRQLELMANSPNPLQERLAWILQGIVVVGVTDFVSFSDLQGHIARLRVNPFGSYTKLLRDTAILPGMMKYLSGYENSADHPNQNYGRELMELFSLGLENLVTGATNYSQEDVIQVARALTGYTYDWTTNKIVFDRSSFDSGQKHFFGRNQGDAGTPQVLTAVSKHPAYRFFIPARLYMELVGRVPDVEELKELGKLWGAAGDVRSVVTAIAHSPAFLAPSAIGCRVKSPVELLASGARVDALPPRAVGLRLADELVHEPAPVLPAERVGVADGNRVAERRSGHDLGRHRAGLRRRLCQVDHRRRCRARADGVADQSPRGCGPSLRHHGSLDDHGARPPCLHDERDVGSRSRGGHAGAGPGLSRILGQLGGVDGHGAHSAELSGP